MTQLTGGGKLEDHLLTLVYRRDGIVNVDFINMVCEVAETADKFKRAVNALTFQYGCTHMQHLAGSCTRSKCLYSPQSHMTFNQSD